MGKIYSKRLFTFILALSMLVSIFTVLPIDTQAVTGHTYYVDSVKGNDAKSGTSKAKAWKSLNKVNSKTFAAGDKILFKTGSKFIGTLSPLGSGEKGSPIIIDKYGEGSKPIINGNGKANAVHLLGQSYWEINNLEVTNNAAAEGERRGIFIEAKKGTTNHVYIKNCYIHNVRGNNDFSTGKTTGGIILYGDNGETTNYNDILIANNTINNCDRSGILAVEACGIYSTNVIVKNNAINFPGGDGIIMLQCTKPLIEYNVCNTSDAVSTGVSCAIWPYACNGAVFQYNEAYNSKLSSDLDDGQAWDVDGNNNDTIYQYNYSHDNQGGSLLLCSNESGPSNNSTIRYNISQNDLGRVITLTGPGTNTFYYNNTVYLSTKMKTKIVDATNYGGWHNGFTAYNNIFYNLGSGDYSFNQSTNILFDYNVFYGKHPVNEPQDAHKITSDPKFVKPGSGKLGIKTVAGYKLQAGSPCIDSGINITNNGGKDYFGNVAPQGKTTDRGAAEYKSKLKADKTVATITIKPAETTKQIETKNLGVNLAKGCTAAASSAEVDTLAASKATDGNDVSRWASLEGVSGIEWLSIDLGSEKSINTVLIKWESAFAKTYQLQVSPDGVNYTDVATVNNTKKIAQDIKTFADTKARYVRLYCTEKADADWGYSLYELEVYGASGMGEIPATVPSKPATTPAIIPTSTKPNLLLNAGFEAVDESWQDWGNSVIEASNAKSGTHSLKTGKESGGRGQIVTTVIEGKSYTFSVWGKVSEDGISGSIGVDLLDDADKATGDQQAISFTETEYTQKAITFTVPKGTKKFQVFVWKEQAEGDGYIYADDFSLTID